VFVRLILSPTSPREILHAGPEEAVFTKHLLFPPDGDVFISVANHESLRGHQPFTSRLVSKILPAQSVTPSHGTCAIVGNSGILKKGGYGQSINAHDVVMRINQAPVIGYEEVVGSRTTYRMLNNKWTTVYFEDNVPNTDVPGGTSQLARYLLKQEPANLLFIVSRASTQQFETLATTVQRRRKDIKTPMLLSSRLVSAARNMLVEFRSSAGGDHDGNPKYSEEELTPSTGLLGVYFLLQSCKHVSVYGFSLDDSRRTNDMKAEGLRYHYFKKYADSERLLAHPHHNFKLEGDILHKLDELGVISLCTPGGLHETDGACRL